MNHDEERANPAIVALLLDCEDLRAYPNLVRRNGKRYTACEVDLIGQATVEDVRACARLARAEADFARTQAEDADRIVQILSGTAAWSCGETVGQMLDQLDPVLRDEAEQILGRQHPDGYIWLEGW